ncbi:hypothetical protein BH24ACT20_BH24ACT20_09640 [soil metagenome]
MPSRYSTTRRGHDIEVEVDNSLILVTRLRLFVDGFSADERYAVWGEVRLHGELRGDQIRRSMTVEVGVGLLGYATRCVVVEDGVEYTLAELRGSLSAPVSKDRELLEAMRENGGRVTPAEAAMATSLSVREADGLLSELSGGGHLTVEREGGALVYALPGRSGQSEIEDS